MRRKKNAREYLSNCSLAYFSLYAFFCLLLFFLPLRRTLGGSHFISSQFKVFLPRSYHFQFHHSHVSFFFLSLLLYSILMPMELFFLHFFSFFYCVLVDAVGTKDALAQEYLCVQFIQFGQKNERNWLELVVCNLPRFLFLFYYYKFVWLLFFTLPPALRLFTCQLHVQLLACIVWCYCYFCNFFHHSLLFLLLLFMLDRVYCVQAICHFTFLHLRYAIEI